MAAPYAPGGLTGVGPGRRPPRGRMWGGASEGLPALAARPLGAAWPVRGARQRRAGRGRVRAKLGEDNDRQAGGNKPKDKEKTWGWFFEQPSPATPEELDKLLVQLGNTDRSIAALITEVALPGTLAGLIGAGFGINAFDIGPVGPGDLQRWLLEASPLLVGDFVMFMVLPLLALGGAGANQPGGEAPGGGAGAGAGEEDVTYMSTLPAALGRYPQWCREEGPLARPLLDGLPLPVVAGTAAAAAVAKGLLVRGAVLGGVAAWFYDRFSEAGLGESLGPVLGTFGGMETPLAVVLIAMGVTLVTNLATADPLLGFVEGFALSVIEDSGAGEPSDLYTDAEARMDLADDFGEATNLQNWARVLEIYERMQALSCEQIDYVTVLLACDRLKKWDYSLRVYRAMQRMGVELVPFASEAVMLAAANQEEWAVVKEIAVLAGARGDQLTTAECKALLRAAEATGDAEAARTVLARLEAGDTDFDEEMWAILYELVGQDAGEGGAEMESLRGRWETVCSMGWVAPPTRRDPMAATDAPYQGVAGWTEPQLGGAISAWDPTEVDTLRSFAYWAVLSAQFFASGGLAAPTATAVAAELLYVAYVRFGPRGGRQLLSSEFPGAEPRF